MDSGSGLISLLSGSSGVTHMEWNWKRIIGGMLAFLLALLLLPRQASAAPFEERRKTEVEITSVWEIPGAESTSICVH